MYFVMPLLLCDHCYIVATLLDSALYCHMLTLMLKTDLYIAILKSEDSEALDSGTISQLGSQRGFGGIEMF